LLQELVPNGTVLHELAHLLMTFGNITKKQKENLRHQFAGAMLLPEETIKSEPCEVRVVAYTCQVAVPQAIACFPESKD